MISHRVWAVFFAVGLTGCLRVNGDLNYLSSNQKQDINYLPIGIPYFLGGHGSAIPITTHLSLTAKHVAKYDYSKVIAYHPDCDIALIEQNNSDKTLATIGVIYPEQEITTVGIGLIGKPIFGKGKYFLDVNFADSEAFKNCPASITDAPIQSGMSGGGAFNTKGELVGIISSMGGANFRIVNGPQLDNKRTSIFVPLLFVRPWLDEQIARYQP